MKLITKAIAKKMPKLGATDGTPFDEKVIQLKLFNPCGAQTWLITEASALMSDGSELPLSDERAEGAEDVMMFGHCDLGFGCPEWGYVSLSELEALRLPWGLRIERDMYFGTPKFGELSK